MLSLVFPLLRCLALLKSAPDRPTTEIIEGRSPHLALARVELRVSAGPDKGLRFEVPSHAIKIGSHPDCDVVLSDRAVSARHAEILVDRGGYVIRDLHSKNGFFIGGYPVREALLVDPMRIRLGHTVISVHARGDTQTVPLAEAGFIEELVVQSPQMRAAMAPLQQLATSPVTMLIEGETGTGKEVVARTIHELSVRREMPFVPVDCGAVPSSLIAAELFGHERGAFSGATEARAGLFESARGGTIFLDEIGELPLEVQPVFLRALENKKARRVGGNSDVSYDVRIVAATNRNLEQMVKLKQFREDLYYRLAVGRIRIPPLRARKQDIELLARRFAEEQGLVLTDDVLTLFQGYRWPGNVRQLKNVVERIAYLPTESHLLFSDELQSDPAQRAKGEILPLRQARQLANAEFEADYVKRVWRQCDFNVGRAACAAGVSRTLMSRLISRHRLREQGSAEDEEA